MKIFKIGEMFWDGPCATEVEILAPHGVDCYFCKTIAGACDDDDGVEGRQFFTTRELRNMRSI